MAEYWHHQEKKIAGVIPIHFNVLDHALLLDDFMATAVQIEEIVKEFNHQLFEGKVTVEVLILPPVAGTFLTKLAVVTTTVISGAFIFLESDIGKSFVHGLTDHKPAYFSEQAGEHLKEIFKGDSKLQDSVDMQNQCMINIILSESTQSFLSKDHQTLRKAGLTKEKLRPAYEAKNEFYKTCHNNSSIQSIGFSETDDFPIDRNFFLEQVITLPEKENQKADGPWSVEIVDIIATSPNWDPMDNQRYWKARYPKGRLWTFRLDDEIFWDLIQRNKITAAAPDFMKVQIAYVEEGSKRKNNTVLRVLEFNGRKVSPALKGNELFEKLGTYKENQSLQINMFD